jgi:hypothetical protein
VIDGNTDQILEKRCLVLPFECERVHVNENLLTTWGSYRSFTIINYVLSTSSGGSEAIGMFPRFGLPPKSPYSLEDLRESLYFLRSGLERRFIYKFFFSTHSPYHRQPALTRLSCDTLDAIAVAIPSRAERMEVRDGKTEIPAHEFDNGTARFYPGRTQDAKAGLLELRYRLPPTSTQKLVSGFLLRILGAILIPVLQLLLLGPAEIINPRMRKIALWIGALVQLLILLILIWMTVHIWGESSLRNILDLAVIVVGGAFAAIVLLVKRKDQAATA